MALVENFPHAHIAAYLAVYLRHNVKSQLVFQYIVIERFVAPRNGKARLFNRFNRRNIRFRGFSYYQFPALFHMKLLLFRSLANRKLPCFKFLLRLRFPHVIRQQILAFYRI